MLYMVAENSNCIHAICTQEHASTCKCSEHIVGTNVGWVSKGVWLAACGMLYTVYYVQHATDSVP